MIMMLYGYDAMEKEGELTPSSYGFQYQPHHLDVINFINSTPKCLILAQRGMLDSDNTFFLDISVSNIFNIHKTMINLKGEKRLLQVIFTTGQLLIQTFPYF